MPTGTPYSSFVAPYNIRVDDFADSKILQIPVPALYLLSHTHTDHLTGLASKSFGARIICSEDAKAMLLRHEVYAERALLSNEMRAERVRTFAHLKVDSGLHSCSRDLLYALPLNKPTSIEVSNEETVTVTLLDANHCLGAVMFLIEGSMGAVLHTGDFRAEPWFLQSITRNPLLQRYLAPSHLWRKDIKLAKQPSPIQTLEAVYLDTACVLTVHPVTAKEEATIGLMQLMMLYPPSTRFFINSWTWGYEDILKAVARTFNTQIHVDRYKYDVYMHTSDPFLRGLITRDPKATRFHACERFDRCHEVPRDDREVIYVNPVDMSRTQWELYLATHKSAIANGQPPSSLLVPLARHSPLPELQSFVALFQPKRVVPNTLIPALQGLDWACMPWMFGPYMAPGGTARMAAEVRAAGIHHAIRTFDLQADAQVEDVSLANVEGDGALELAQRWAEGRIVGNAGQMRRVLERLRPYLDGEVKAVVERLLRGEDPREGGRGRQVESDEETDDDEEERARTAEKIFGIERPSPSVAPFSPLSSSPAEKPVLATPQRTIQRRPKNLQLATPSSSAHAHVGGQIPGPSARDRAPSSSTRVFRAEFPTLVFCSSSPSSSRLPFESNKPRKRGASGGSRSPSTKRQKRDEASRLPPPPSAVPSTSSAKVTGPLTRTGSENIILSAPSTDRATSSQHGNETKQYTPGKRNRNQASASHAQASSAGRRERHAARLVRKQESMRIAERLSRACPELAVGRAELQPKSAPILIPSPPTSSPAINALRADLRSVSDSRPQHGRTPANAQSARVSTSSRSTLVLLQESKKAPNASLHGSISPGTHTSTHVPDSLEYEIRNPASIEMDWERAERLAEDVREDLRLGRAPTLPRLQCLSP